MILGFALLEIKREGEIVLPAFGLSSKVKRVSAFSSYSQRPQISQQVGTELLDRLVVPG